ncbi:tandem-95 repeat protein [Desulfopila sp. IMCC35008]|uniref:tandem-95 repeat protein n=1 Tax=Desulfopila sp. IMCC35008 TaxID=2653858 RepID=UPI0013D8B458|nr:tandem-95 repeat protein [Desulfopila sp. IMCC35008]
MIKKIKLSLFIDGTGNNNNDASRGKTTNVAKIFELQKADAAFDFSENGTAAVPSYERGLTGTSEAYQEYLKKSKSLAISSTEETLSLKIYHDGVGSQKDQNSLIAGTEGATGLGTELRVNKMIDAIRQIRQQFPDAEIDLNAMGFSRGSTAIKDFLNKIAQEFPGDNNIKLNNAVLFDPVAAYGYGKDETHMGKDLSYPEIADENTTIHEIIAGNEYRKDSFALNPYLHDSVSHSLQPGAHAQAGGGYANDILAAGNLGLAIEHWAKDSGIEVDLKKITVEDLMKMRMYNAIIENPFLVRALITDSRVKSEDLARPGVLLDDDGNVKSINEQFTAEEKSDNGEFDNPDDGRHVERERNALSADYITKIASDVSDGIRQIFDSNYYNEKYTSAKKVAENYTAGDVQVSTIAQQGYSQISFIKENVKLPAELESIVKQFEESVKSIDYSLEVMDSEDGVQQSIDQLKELITNTKNDIVNINTSKSNSDDNLQSTIYDTFELLETRLNYYEKRNSEEFEEIRNLTDETIAKEICNAQLDFLDSFSTLSHAFKSDDVLDIGAGIIDFSLKLDALSDKYDPANSYNVRNKKEDIERAGFFDETKEKLIGVVSGGLSILQSCKDGNEIEALQSTASLLLSIDNYLEKRAKYDNEQAFDPDKVGLSEHQEYVARISCSVLGVASAFEFGDDVDKAIATLDLVTNLSDNYVGILEPVSIGLDTYKSYENLCDSFDSGDAAAIGSASARFANDSVQSYNYVANCFETLPSIPTPYVAYLGYATAAMQLAQGNVEGAALSAASCAVSYMVVQGLMATGVGAIAGIVIMMASKALEDGPPTAHAVFSLDEKGTVVLHVQGDREMQDMADSYGNMMKSMMQQFKDDGNRLEIDGRIPYIKVEAGVDPKICYKSEYGGKMSVILDDDSNPMMDMRGVLYARDRGDRLGDAVRIATNDSGEVDFDKVDTVMSGHGFVKKGFTYTSGEDNCTRQGYAVGTGIFNGGGNDGPEGKHFVAKSSDFKSLPLRPDQLPNQKMGDILKIINLNSIFSGVGSELLAMALILPGGLAALPESAFGGESVYPPFNGDAIVPLGGFEIAAYLTGDLKIAQQEIAASAVSVEVSIPILDDPVEMKMFLTENWKTIISGVENIPGLDADRVYQVREETGYDTLLSDGTRPTWFSRELGDEFLISLKNDGIVSLEFMDGEKRSFTGQKVAVPANDDIVDHTLSHVSNSSSPYATVTCMFKMAEDSVLRLLPVDLAEDTLSEQYSVMAEQYVFAGLGKAVNGRVWQEDGGDIRFEPSPDFAGVSSFTYYLQSPSGQRIEKSATVLVENVNDAPELVDDTITLHEGEVLYLDRLLGNDHDPEGDGLLIDHLRGVEHGEVVMVNGRLAFIPEEGYYGDVEFSYWVRDHADSYPVMAVANISVMDRNLGPQAGNDRFLVLEDTALITTADKLLANDEEHDGESLIFDGLSSARHGVVSQRPDGSIEFIPDANYVGTEAGFYYHVKDESGNSSSAWVGVEVLDTREAPVVIADTIDPLAEDELLTFTPQKLSEFIYDADGDVLHLEMISNVTGGAIITRNGYYSFLPDANYSGKASFDYRANDNHRGIVDGHLEFEVLPENDPIITGEDSGTTIEEQAVTFKVADLLINDSDIDGSVLSFSGLGESKNGTVSVDGDVITFQPDQDYAGDEAGFDYRVVDSDGVESIGSVLIQVENVNDAPQVINDSISIKEDQPLVFDDAILASVMKDSDGDELTISKVEVVRGGTVNENGGIFTFTPEAEFSGTGAVRITVQEEGGATVTSEIQLNIQRVNDPAKISEDSFTTIEEQSITTTVAALMANDRDVDSSLDFVRLGEEKNGSVAIDGDGNITFTPNTDYYGPAGFEYVVADSEGIESFGWATVQVSNENDAPIIVAGLRTVLEDSPIVFTKEFIATIISDVDGDEVKITEVTNVTGGDVIKEGGVYTFTPQANYHGKATLSYKAEDPSGAEVSGKLDLELLAVDDATDFGDDHLSGMEEQSVFTSVAELLANDSDLDGSGKVEFVGLGTSRNGLVTLATDGSIEFIPTMDYFGDDAGFSYNVCDDEGNESSGWVSISIENVNDVPVITGNRLHLDEDESLAFTADEIAKFISDADGELFKLDMVANVEGGRIEVKNGVYTFIPDEDYYGEASFDYTASNESGEEVFGGLHLALTPVNDLPATTFLHCAGVEDSEITMKVETLMEGAADIEDGDNLRYGGIESSVHGDVFVDNMGVLHFLPDDDYFGNAFFRYNVLDSEGGASQGYVGIEIAGENDNPVAMDDERFVAWSNKSYENVFPAFTFLANDVDVDGDQLRIVSACDTEYGSVTVDANGNIHYVAPSDDWVGVDSFSYSISDGHGGIAEATAQLDVKINTSPDVYSEVIFTREDFISILTEDELLANDSDVDGDVMHIIGVDQAEHCSVQLLSDSSAKFTPELNYNNHYPGQASFRYTVSDGISDPVSAVAFFDIDPVNDKPIIRSERISGAVEDNSFSFQAADLMANDTDVEMASPYEEDSITFAGIVGADHGRISYNSQTDTVFYVPDANFCGVETFRYKIVDSYGAATVDTSQIYVLPVNDLPVVEYDVSHGAEDSVWNKFNRSNLLSNDYDVDGDTLNIVNPYVISGVASVNVSGGDLMVKPGFREDKVVVGYMVSDGNGGNVESRLTLNDIREHNFAPVFQSVKVVSHSRQVREYDNDNNDTTRYVQREAVVFDFVASDRNGSSDIVSVAPAGFRSNFKWTKLEASGGHITFHGTSEYSGHLGGGNISSGKDWEASWTVTATDRAGATGTAMVRFDGKYGKGSASYVYSPVIFDLDGDGVELVGLDTGVGFDWNLDGETERTGWVGCDDGILVYDYDQDRTVQYANELVLTEYDRNAATDLEGLIAFDTNKDGCFSKDDERWCDFGVWQDKDSDGVTDEDEYKTLDEAAVSIINLQSDDQYHEDHGNIVYGSTTYETSDGKIHEAADVGLVGEEIDLALEYVSEPMADQLPENSSTVTGLTAPLISAETVSEDGNFHGLGENVGAKEGIQQIDLESDTVDQETSGHLDLVNNCYEGLSPETTDEIGNTVLVMGEAEINHIAGQLCSDMATSIHGDSQIGEPELTTLGEGLEIPIVPDDVADAEAPFIG